MSEKPVILFDGVCNFCNSMVNFIIRQDKKKIFRFAALQSAYGQKLIEENDLKSIGNDSFILFENGRAYQRSTAALKVNNKLPWYWKWAQLGWILPPFIRNGIYNWIARNRYKWFGKKDECMVPTQELKDRFLE